MSKVKHLPLAGDFVSPEPDADISVWTARLRLLEAIKRVYPVVIDTLAFRVFPDYSPLASKGQLCQYDQLTLDRSTSPEIRRFKTGFDSWAKQFHFEYEWMKDDALRAMWIWHIEPGSVKQFRWNPSEIFPGIARPIVLAPSFKVSVHGWSMETQTWPSYEEEVRAEFERRLSAYKKHAERLAALNGLVRAPRTYSPANFDWFVRSQFAGESPTTIAERKRVKGGESTVRKGIKAARRLLGIDPSNRPRLEAPKPTNGVIDQLTEAIKVRRFIDDRNVSDIATGNVPMRWNGTKTVARNPSRPLPKRNRTPLSMLRPRKSP